MLRIAILVLVSVVAVCSCMSPPNQYLHKEGVLARAVVTSLEQTGTFINHQPVCDIGLSIQPPGGGEPFSSSIRQVVLLTDIPKLQPGTVLTVRYDVRDHSKAFIEGAGEPPSVSNEQAETMALAGQSLFLELSAPGVADSYAAVVLAFEPLGVHMNGDNPLAVMTVKVLPAGGGYYDAKITAVFGQSNLPKYQPGHEIYVLVDKKDPQRVTVDHARMHIP
ncbi:MAG: hypothetical protein FWD69_12965 [Polyangiaceae bacterium]|nr:hypothetical protein [Polyangiaceae bacterium]